MNLILHEILILLLVFIPFFLVGLAAIYSVSTGFFQTEVLKQLDKKEMFYFDKLFRAISPHIIFGVFLVITTISITVPLKLQDSFIIITIWLSFVCLRWTCNSFRMLQVFVWEEYANHKDKYNPDTKKYDKTHSKFRINYPTPEIHENELMKEPCSRDSEMIFIYKLVHGVYSNKVNSWEELRNVIIKNKKWRRKRKLLLSTSKKFTTKETYEDWQDNWGINNLSPDIIWSDLKNIDNFNEFAQKWHFYAILISRGTISKLNKLLFHPLLHVGAIGGVAIIYYSLVSSYAVDMQLNANIILSSLLFGISVLFSIIYSVIALMLFIYGKVVTINDFNLPIPKLGEPFFAETSRVAVILSISTAITVGLGIPLTLTLNISSSISVFGAILAGLITAFIFVLSVWGTHFSMDNTKSKVLDRLFNQIVSEEDGLMLERLLLKYTEVKAVPIWPVNIIVYINIIAALVFPIILEKIFDKIAL